VFISFQIMGMPDEAYSFISRLDQVGELSFVPYYHKNGYACRIYSDSNGTRYIEYEQSCPWVSGPMLFLGLKNEKTGEILFSWTQEAMDEYVR